MSDEQRQTVAAIHAYTRVVELHLKAIEQGANPLKGSDAVQHAVRGLDREVALLRFLREPDLRRTASHEET